MGGAIACANQLWRASSQRMRGERMGTLLVRGEPLGVCSCSGSKHGCSIRRGDSPRMVGGERGVCYRAVIAAALAGPADTLVAGPPARPAEHSRRCGRLVGARSQRKLLREAATVEVATVPRASSDTAPRAKRATPSTPSFGPDIERIVQDTFEGSVVPRSYSHEKASCLAAQLLERLYDESFVAFLRDVCAA